MKILIKEEYFQSNNDLCVDFGKTIPGVCVSHVRKQQEIIQVRLVHNNRRTKITIYIVSKVEGYRVLDRVEVGEIHTYASLMKKTFVKEKHLL